VRLETKTEHIKHLAQRIQMYSVLLCLCWRRRDI